MSIYQSNKQFTIRTSKQKIVNPPVIEEVQGQYFFGRNIILNGVMYLMGEVNDDSVLPIIQSIMEYNLMHPDDQPGHLTLFINSPGGLVSSAYHLIDMIRQSPIPVHTIGMGEVASAGVMLLMSGQKGHRMVSELF